MNRYRTTLFYGISYVVILAVAIRSLGFYFEYSHPHWWLVVALLVSFALLLVAIERNFSHRAGWHPHLYLTLQMGLISALSLFRPPQDFFNALYLPLSGQAMFMLPRRTAFTWLGLFSLVMAGSLVMAYEWRNALGLAILYAAGYFFVGSYANITIQADAARQDSQKLLMELQEAHRQLQAYAAQVEELAVTQERNRLARDLHDSVTQTLFSMTLTTRAICLMLEENPQEAAVQLEHLQKLAESALAEMRSLIAQLRPSAIEAQGFIPTLRQHLTMRHQRDNLSVTLEVTDEPRLSPQQARNLFGIVQEALNNVVKHAQTDQATVTVSQADGTIYVAVEDHGVGFEMASVQSDMMGIGFVNMRERAEMLGGTLAITASPGKGTCIQVKAPLERDNEREN